MYTLSRSILAWAVKLLVSYFLPVNPVLNPIPLIIPASVPASPVTSPEFVTAPAPVYASKEESVPNSSV